MNPRQGGRARTQSLLKVQNLSWDKYADKIRSLGGTFQTAVGKDTSYLVLGQSVGASKLKKAEKLGTKQIIEKDLLNLFERS